jgi:signal transduction histidine kinase
MTRTCVIGLVVVLTALPARALPAVTPSRQLAASEQPAAERLPVRSYTVDDGLAGDEILEILQQSNGFLWIATDSGLSRFDGARFVNYDSRHGLPSPHVTAVEESSQGDLLVATTAGMARLDPQATLASKTFVPLQTGRRHLGRATALLSDGPFMWLAETPGGALLRLRRSGDSFAVEPARLASGQPLTGVNALTGGGARGVWAGGSGGVAFRLPNSAWQAVELPAPAGKAPVESLLADREGRLWIATARGLFVVGLGSPVHATPIEACSFNASSALQAGQICRFPGVSESGERVSSMIESAEGEIWLATNERLCSIHRGNLRSFSHRNGLFDDYPVTLAEDRDGGLWAGSHDHGLVRIAHHGFVTFAMPSSSPVFVVAQILEDSDGRLLVWGKSHQVGHLLAVDQDHLVDLTPAALAQSGDPGRGRHQVIAFGPDGQLAIATSRGVWQIPLTGGKTVPRLAPAPPALGEVVRLYRDSRQRFWVGGLGDSAAGWPPAPKMTVALWNAEDGSFRGVPEIERLDRGAPSAFVEDAAGSLWIGFSGGGLARYRNGTVDLFLSADGVPAGGVSDLLVDSTDRLWVATSYGGLSSVENLTASHPRWRNYTAATGLSSDHILCLTSDRRGLLYLGNGRGIDQFDPKTGSVRALTVGDGLPANRVAVAAATRTGALWFGTVAGLSRYQPEAVRREAAPAVLLGSLRIGGIPTALPPLGTPRLEDLRIPVSRNPIEIHLIGISDAYGASLRYQYRLSGGAGTWSEPRAEHTILLGNLASGDYQAEFRAVAPDGTVSRSPAVLGFTLVPPVWQRGWFLALAALALGSLLAAAHRARVARLLELERVRTRIAADLHDDLGSSLSRISILSELGRRQSSADGEEGESSALEQIGETARELMEATSDIVWAIDSRRDDLATLLARVRRFAADLLEPRGVRLIYSPPAHADQIALGPESKRELYLVLKEAVHNAARHAQAQHVWLEVSADERLLIAIVRDDGIGFAATDGSAPLAPETRGGNGLRNLHARAARLGATLAVESQPGVGTSVRLSLRR